MRLANHAAELVKIVAPADRDIASKLKELARLHLGEAASSEQDTMKPAPGILDLSKSDTPGPHGRAILEHLRLYQIHKDKAYLEAAVRQARLAYVRFMDETCPLPKAYETPRKTAEGDPFPDFYFRGAKLMHAFALLGEVLRKEP